MNKKPIISIIMASYNHSAFIGEAIESVKQQDFDSWELLIADDCSTDETLEVLALYKNDPRIKIFPFEFNRQYHMRNFAARHARGEYIAFLNSDDIFLPGKLSKQICYLEKNPEVAAVFTHVKGIDETGKSLPYDRIEKVYDVKDRPRHEWLRHFFVDRNCFCISSVLVRGDCFREVGMFNPLLIQVADVDLWIKLCFKWDIHVIEEKLTGMRRLSLGRNLSASGSITRSRAFLEYQYAYGHYFSENGIEQMLRIFPELNTLLPEDITQWRRYLLCRIAAFLPSKPVRLIGFSKMHELLNNEETKNTLEQKNPRLLRTFFLSEGTAGLWHDDPGVLWKLSFPNQEGVYSNQRPYSYWTIGLNKGVVCFSFPNPQASTVFSLSIEADPVPVKCLRFRLYAQETWEMFFDSETNGKINPTRHNWYRNYYFPKIDFTAINSKWVDIEIECVPDRSYPFLRLMRRTLGKKCARLMSSVKW